MADDRQAGVREALDAADYRLGQLLGNTDSDDEALRLVREARSALAVAQVPPLSQPIGDDWASSDHERELRHVKALAVAQVPAPTDEHGEPESPWDDESIVVRRVLAKDGRMLLVVGPFSGPALADAQVPAHITSTDQLEAEQRGLPIPFPAQEERLDVVDETGRAVARVAARMGLMSEADFMEVFEKGRREAAGLSTPSQTTEPARPYDYEDEGLGGT